MMRSGAVPGSSFPIRLLQGAAIGLGAVLPGVSGGVLCVVFGLYEPIMEVLADPLRRLRSGARLLLPVVLGGLIGFLGIANALSFFLDRYPSQSVCLFAGLIAGMLPSLFREAGRRSRSAWACLAVGMALVFALLTALRLLRARIEPGFAGYLLCGFCLALSVVVPGMSFSTLLMPLGLYEPFVAGLGRMRLTTIVPAGIGAVLTLLLLSRAIGALFARHASAARHAVIGVVIAATMDVIPISAFVSCGAGFWIHTLCVLLGTIAALLLDGLGRRFGGCGIPE